MAFYPGPVPLDEDNYVQRQFEEDALGELMAGHWVLLLGPRQHGKTSALYRLRSRIREGGIVCAYVDLQTQPPLATYADFVMWFAGRVAADVGCEFEPTDPLDDLHAALESSLPSGGQPVVLLIDEASNIRDEAWRNAFYGQLRGLHGVRDLKPEGDISKRATFLFSGTFKPETLIDEGNSPFNICERIETQDLSIDQVRHLVGLNLAPELVDATTQAIFGNTGGQPFLAQRLIGRAKGSQDVAEAIELHLQQLRTGHSDHITNVFTRVLAEERLVRMVSQLAANDEIPNAAADADCAYLCTCGVAKRDGARLVFRNETYRQVARTTPNFVNAPAEPATVAIFPLPEVRFQKIQSPALREIAYNAQKGAVAAFNGNSYRVALVGYGCALEALLMDYLRQKSGPDLTTARQNSNCNLNHHEQAADPTTWRLVNLIKAANHFLQNADNGTEALRDWRNLIHPKVAMASGKKDADLEPEARAAVALHEIILRDIP